ncbi:hypothetical protein THAOC_27866, partial [Thalassiosira oceanica]
MERMAWRSDVDLLHRQSAASFIGMGPARDGGGGGAEGRGSGSRGGTLGKWEGKRHRTAEVLPASEEWERRSRRSKNPQRTRGQRRKRAAVTVRGGVIAASSTAEGAPETTASRGPQGAASTAVAVAELKTRGLASSLQTKALSSTTARLPAVHEAMAEAQYLATTAASDSPGELQTPKEAGDGSDAGGDGAKHAGEYPFGELGSPHREGRRGDPVRPVMGGYRQPALA